MNNDVYLSSAKKQFQVYKSLGEKTFKQLSDEQLYWTYNSESNSIALIVKHLWGNMLSRWTDFLISDGEKEWRNRDSEFEIDGSGKELILERWESGWQTLFQTLESLGSEDLQKEIIIRNESLVVTDAINRQLCHYAYHIGQIVYIGKMICNENWTSLSIPKGKSKEYNLGMLTKK
ncbi:MAG: DUF1572 family protein [Saprospiraceae bacterium]